ncbi:MAG: glucosaminidase domain-containing protein [Treponema sp.]|nr:glucosaminidase domain-containing protein [Treponema sp.]
MKLRHTALLAACVILLLTGCASGRHGSAHSPETGNGSWFPAHKTVSRKLSDPGIKSAMQLCQFFMANRPDANKSEVRKLALLYRNEAAAEGINSDCAFIQMCLETGFLTFGNLVTEDMHNYCGLGAIDEEHPGESFETMQLGVRAHIQHLHAYATPEGTPLKNECIDRRYKYVRPRGKAPTIYDLSGTWAADTGYGDKLDGLLSRLEEY